MATADLVSSETEGASHCVLTSQTGDRSLARGWPICVPCVHGAEQGDHRSCGPKGSSSAWKENPSLRFGPRSRAPEDPPHRCPAEAKHLGPGPAPLSLARLPGSSRWRTTFLVFPVLGKTKMSPCSIHWLTLVPPICFQYLQQAQSLVKLRPLKTSLVIGGVPEVHRLLCHAAFAVWLTATG